MSAKVTPGGPGEEGFEHVELDLILNQAEKAELAEILEQHGWHYEAEALRDE